MQLKDKGSEVYCKFFRRAVYNIGHSIFDWTRNLCVFLEINKVHNLTIILNSHSNTQTPLVRYNVFCELLPVPPEDLEPLQVQVCHRFQVQIMISNGLVSGFHNLNAVFASKQVFHENPSCCLNLGHP